MKTLERLCRHFGDCGGCSTQNMSYEEQLAVKEQRVAEVVKHFSPDKFHPIRPSPEIIYYRNKMEFAFSQDRQGHRFLGLRKKGRFDRVVDLEECFLMSPEAPRLLETLRAWAGKENIPFYHRRSHQGFLRYAVIREGKNTGQRMLHLVTAPGRLPEQSLLDALDKSGVPLDTVIWSVQEGLSDVASGQTSKTLRGSGTIEERLHQLPFRISPTTFFQTNTKGAEVLYQIVADFLGPQVDLLLDVYCGSGSIGLFCASRAKRVVGVEVHGPSVEDARFNAKNQGVTHAEFLSMDCATLRNQPQLLNLWKQPGKAVVLDPPRPGLHPQMRQLLLDHPVERLVYISCNPTALAADLPFLKSVYRLASVMPVDLFPHTPHVETVVLLTQGK